jgi:FADH2 O2-dependent halogenase
MARQLPDVAIIGSGFAGSILARALNRSGFRVSLIEKARHPRFALGESSTPLAALSLERLARRYDLPDLAALAAWGRWKQQLPGLRCGLKRGFTFYHHVPNQSFESTARNEGRLLVAASPDDSISDCHWLREDVDHYLVDRALAEGVEYFDRVVLTQVERKAAGRWRILGSRLGEPFELTPNVIVDGTGRSGFMAQQLDIANRTGEQQPDTSLVFGHFEGVKPWDSMVEWAPGGSEDRPYEDERAAVHHLLEEGWLYSLRFDDERVSAGISIRRDWLKRLGIDAETEPERAWSMVLGRYPSLQSQFDGASRLMPLRYVDRVQHRLERPCGEGWVALPHTYAFVDPLFSTGIAWSLLAVERLALLMERDETSAGIGTVGSGVDFEPYGALLEKEADQITRLIQGAYLAMDHFRLFAAQSFLYFSTVSFQELQQRLQVGSADPGSSAWQGFLGAGDVDTERLFVESNSRLRALKEVEDATDTLDAESYDRWIREQIECRNVIGLSDPSRNNLYPVDIDLLLSRAELLGLTRDEMQARVHLLRGGSFQEQTRI